MSAMRGRTGTTFSHESTRAVLAEACDHIGVNSDDAELLRLGENAIYRVTTPPIVVRIARNADHWDDVVKEVRVADWLEQAGIPAARTWPTEQPLSVGGHPVTCWRYIEGRRGGPGDVRELGGVLRRVHALPRPTTFALPPEEMLGRVRPRIDRAPVPAADRVFLVGLLDELTAAVAELDYVLPGCVTHGDAHVQNLMIADGEVVLIDFERVAWGQPEWDLAMTATEFVTAQFWNPDQYRAFVDSYGYDVTEWAGFPIVRRVHEVKMTTWLMQNINESTEIRDEYEVRMATIRAGRPGPPWRAF